MSDQFPEPKDQVLTSRYTEVHVLILSWEDVDPKLPVNLEMDPLFDVFQDMYNFKTERWQIPNLRSHKRVNDRVAEFLGGVSVSLTTLNEAIRTLELELYRLENKTRTTSRNQLHYSP